MGAAQAAALPDFQYAGASSVSCAAHGVALGDEAGAVGGMDGSLEAASLADLKEVLSADKQATFREPRGRVRARYSLLSVSGR